MTRPLATSAQLVRLLKVRGSPRIVKVYSLKAPRPVDSLLFEWWRQIFRSFFQDLVESFRSPQSTCDDPTVYVTFLCFAHSLGRFGDEIGDPVKDRSEQSLLLFTVL